MELVLLMYRYINKFINGEKLLEEIGGLDKSKYNKTELDKMEKLFNSINYAIENSKNKISKEEKERIDGIDTLLNKIDNKDYDNKEEEDYLNRIKDVLERDKKNIRDSEKLYESIFKLLTKNDLINKYAEKMTDEELFDMITRYIYAPNPPIIDNSGFDDLVRVGIDNDDREGLWRLAMNYDMKGFDFTDIVIHYIEKRDAYYITELISGVIDSLDMNDVMDRIIHTQDKKFIKEVLDTGNDICIFEDDKVKELEGAL